MRQMCLHGGARQVIETMTTETPAVAGALDCEVGVSIERRLAGAEKAGDHRTSTPQDLERGKPLERDAPPTDSACVYCGDRVEVRPTGAVSSESEFDMRAAGTWDGSRQSETTTVCAYCGVGRSLALHVQDNEIVKVTSPHDNPVTRGNLCIKGRFGCRHVRNRD
ncbi:ketopantoate reductase C-terminal domain-containing protein [Streptomyces caelestis]|uniref:ketopantoate reductase C-terminal domain-containing protein n=1 Tax=Streptomyces caelestis TaxID=36816 RepID=UPI00364FF32A